MNTNEHLDKLYQQRFPDAEQQQKDAIWQVLCSDFFQRFVRETDTIVDLGAGYCEFINNIRAGRKIAVDLNPDVRRFAAAGVEVIQAPSTAIGQVADGSADVVFMSNFLEHLPDKAAVLATLREAWRMLRPGGRVIVLQPNIRYLPGEYWDFFDHHTPLTDRSLVEALGIAGFKPQVVHARFLPYTTKSRLPKASFLVRLYLRLPLAWRFFGTQALVVAAKDAEATPADDVPQLAATPPPAMPDTQLPADRSAFATARRLLAHPIPLPLLVAVAALAYLLILALGAPPTARGLDPAWTEVLAWAFLHKAQWGRDLVFTYGPLGFLQPYASYVEGIFPTYAAGAIALPAAFALTLCLLFRHSAVALVALFAAVYLCWCAQLAGDTSWALTLLFGTVFFLRAGNGPASLGWIAAAVVLAPVFGAIALTKFSLFPLWAVCVALIAGLQAAAGRWRRAILLAGGFAAGLAVMWLASGQHLLNLPAFVAAGLEIASGYPHAMGDLAPPHIELYAVALLGLFLVACLYAAWSSRGDRSAVAVAALTALSGLLFWLACFIRGDHWPWFFPALSLLPFALLSDRRLVGARFLSPLLVAVVLLPLLAEPPSSMVFSNAAFRVRNAIHNLGHLGELAAARTKQWRTAMQDAALPHVRARIHDARVDMLTWEQGMLLLNGFSYAPRPVFQSYSAFTPKLARMNEAYFLGPNAPSYALLRLDFIDERLPMSEDGLALIALLRLYRPVLREKGFLLLERHAPLSAKPVTPGEAALPARLGEDVKIDTPATPTIAFADIRLSAFGRLYTLLFREPALRITLHTMNGDKQRYRLVRATAASGFVVNPLITGNSDLIKLYYKKPLHDVDSFSIDTDSWLERYVFADDFPVSFRPLGALAPAPVDVATALLLFPGFNLAPSSDDDFRTIIEDGQESVFMHAPGAIPFKPERGRYRISGIYGLQGLAINDPGCVQANPDGIGMSLVLLHGGREAELAHYSLDPYHVRSDAGPHPFSVDGVEVADGDTVEYRVDNGPSGKNVACDWSYVRDVTFMPSQAPPIQARPQPYPGFNLDPVTTGLRVIDVDGKPAVFLHAPSSITFEPPPARYRVSANFGLQGNAVKDEGCIRAGADGVGLSLVLRRGTRETVLRHVEIDPFHNDKDVGQHALSVDKVDVGAGDHVEWRVDPGHGGENSSCDWSYVRDFVFAREDAVAPAGAPARP